MTCAEFKELAPLAAIGALDAAEEARVEGHLAGQPLHAGCQAVWSEALAAAQLLVEDLPVPRWADASPQRSSAAVAQASQETSRDGLWAGIEAALADETDRAVAQESARAPRARFAGTLALAASVAAVALLIGRQVGLSSGEAARHADRVELAEAEARLAQAKDGQAQAATQTAQLDGQLSGCRRDLGAARNQLEAQRAATTLLGEPATQMVSLASPKPGSAGPSRVNVIFNGPSHRAVVVAGGLIATANKDYELWVIRGKDKIAAGLFQLQASGPSLLAVDEKLLSGGVDLFAITLEPAGGGPVPRGDLVVAGAVKKKS